MVKRNLFKWGLPLAIPAAIVLAAAAARAADVSKGLGPADPSCETVDVFAGIDKGQIAVQLIPRDPWQCRLLVTNKTDKPLNVALPEVLGAAPVLAQFGQPNARNRNNNNANRNGANNASQQLGMPGNQGNPMNQMMGPGNGLMNNRPGQGMMFCVPPEKTGQLRLASLCLDYGKPNPRAAIPYQLKPLDGVTAKPEVGEVLRMLGQGSLGQRPAQAAVWHLNNGLTWQQLQAMKTDKFDPIPQPRFTARDLADAKKAVELAAKQAQERAKSAPSRSTAAR